MTYDEAFEELRAAARGREIHLYSPCGVSEMTQGWRVKVYPFRSPLCDTPLEAIQSIVEKLNEYG